MGELFYFDDMDILIHIAHSENEDLFKYSIHRELSAEEHMRVTQYIVNHIVPQTGFYSKQQSVFISVGVDEKLADKLEEYHKKNGTQGKSHTKTQDTFGDNGHITKAVNGLVDDAMSAYYFGKIGEEIVTLRGIVADTNKRMAVYMCRANLLTLIDSYNNHTVKKVTYQEIVPDELQLL